MKIVEEFQTSISFWEVCPQLIAAGPTKRLYDEDTTKKKEKSSKLMWFIALSTDINSKYYNIPITGTDNKYELLGGDLLGDKKYYTKFKKECDELIEFYCKLQDTPAQRVLREWDEKMIERAKFIKETPFTMDSFDFDEGTGKNIKIAGTADTLDKMMGATKKLYDDYGRIQKDLSVNEIDTENLGGGESSLSDQGDGF